jgi:hypothetical protein
VKVDPALMTSGQDKENMQPSQVVSKSEAQQKREAEQAKLAQEEQLTAEKEAEKRRVEERRKQTEEAARLRQEVEERRVREEAAAKLARKEAAAAAAAEEERLRQEALRVAEEQARNEAAAAAAEEERLRVEEEKRVALTRVNSWCKENGYQTFSTPKKTFKGNTKYALHTAVKHESPEMVKMLMLCGAKKNVKDSKGQTPLQLAEKLKKGNLRDQIMDALA